VTTHAIFVDPRRASLVSFPCAMLLSGKTRLPGGNNLAGDSSRCPIALSQHMPNRRGALVDKVVDRRARRGRRFTLSISTAMKGTIAETLFRPPPKMESAEKSDRRFQSAVLHGARDLWRMAKGASDPFRRPAASSIKSTTRLHGASRFGDSWHRAESSRELAEKLSGRST